MTRLGIVSFLALLLVAFAGSVALRAEPAGPAPDFKEVYDLIRQHLPEINPTELKRIAVQPLGSALNPKMSLGGNQLAAGTFKQGCLVSKTSVFHSRSS